MAAPKRTPFERERDLDRIAEMYLEERTQQEIADVIGVSRTQIQSDIKELERRWQKASIEKMQKRKGRQLAKIGRLERHAWLMLRKTNAEMYEVMKEEGERDGAAFERLSKKIAESASDPRWANVLLSCWKREGEVTGMDAPDKLALVDSAGRDVVTSPAECAAQAVAMLHKMRERKAAVAAGEAAPDADEDDRDEEGSDA